jgi:hypothetical protein
MTTNGERIAGASDILGLMADHRMSDVGGTSGGLGSFLAGLAMTCVGGYLFNAT